MAREKDLTPIGMVAREVSRHSPLTEGVVLRDLRGLLARLMEESWASLEGDPSSSLRVTSEYRTLSETIVAFGTLLRALDDMEEDDLREAGRGLKARLP